tara:strand:+ start:2026 stop:3237 length:1212 start_codon:yes stop_codon:yes gene_type:complete
MDSHTDAAVAEATPESPAVEQLPDATPEEPSSFSDALESALSKLSGEEPEATPEPTPEPTNTPEVAAVQPEEAPESATTEPAETETEPETTEAKDPLDSLTEDVGDDWTPKAASRFKQLKAELKTNRSEVEQLRQTVKEQESKMQEMSGLVENRDIDKLQETISSYEQDKVFSDLEGTAAYKEAVTNPLNHLLNQAVEIADKNGSDADSLIDAIALQDQEQQDLAISKVIPDATERDRAKIYRIIEDIGPILQRRDTLVQNAEEALKEATGLEEQRRNEQAAERAQLRKSVTKSVVEKVSEKLPFLSGVESVDMEAIQAKAADVDPSVVHPVDFAYNAVAAQLLPTIVREYMSSRKEAETLMDKLAAYESAEPTMSGTPAADGSTRPHSDLSFADAIDAALGG